MRRLTTILFITLAGLACNRAVQNVPPATPIDTLVPATENVPTEEPTPESVPANPAGGETTFLVTDLGPTETYVDETLGYAFDYPADWDILALPEIPGATVTLTSWQLVEAGSGGIPTGGQKIDVSPMMNMSYEDALVMIRQQNEGSSYTETILELPYGPQGILFVFPVEEGELEIRQMVTSVNGTTLVFNGLGYSLTYFEAIAYTVRPLE